MEMTDRTEGLRALIRQGLQAVSQQNTTARLETAPPMWA